MSQTGDKKMTRREIVNVAAATPVAMIAGPAAAGDELLAYARPVKTPPITAETMGPIEHSYWTFEVFAKAHDKAGEALEGAEERYDEPVRPDWHPLRDEGGHTVVPTSPGRGHCYLDDSPENIAHLRKIVEAPETVFTLEGWEPDMFPPRVEAARKTLDRILAWQAEAQRRADAAGLTEARAAERQANAAAQELASALLSAEPTTFRDAAFQAAIIEGGCYDDPDLDPFRLAKRLVRLAGIKLYWLETPPEEAVSIADSHPVADKADACRDEADAVLFALREPYERSVAVLTVARKALNQAEAEQAELKGVAPGLDRRQRRTEADVEQAEQAYDRADDACLAIIREIEECPAVTIGGVIFKAQVSAREDNAQTDLLASIVADLVAMGGSHA